jgi:hypothetical protein
MCMFMIYPKLHVPSTGGSLVCIIKLKAKDVHMPAMFVLYILQIYSVIEHCISCKDVLQCVTVALVLSYLTS